MPRPKDMSEVICTQKRWTRLVKFVQKLRGEMKRPMTNTKCRTSVVIAGRMINNIVCTFAVSDVLTNRTLHDLNAVLMRLDTFDDVQSAHSMENDILHSIEHEIHGKVQELDREVIASKVFT